MNVDHDYWPINDDFYVYLPARGYTLTLKHRLLVQLGGFSHLVLDTLADLPDQGISWVQKVTGLGLQELAPILHRLEGLGLISDGQLSPRGQQLMSWKRRLHAQSRPIWLDGWYRDHLFFCLGTAPPAVVSCREDAPFLLRRWSPGKNRPRAWPSLDWNEDCARQKARILSHPEPYLGAVFETFKDCLGDHGFNIQDWDLGVRYLAGTGYFALKVPMRFDQLASGGTGDFFVSSPVICLDTHYRLPEGLPDAASDVLQKQQPKDHRRTMGFGRATEDTEVLADTPPSAWVWPMVDEPTHLQALVALFGKVETSERARIEPVFNRHHALKDCWRAFDIDWGAVEQSVQHVEGVILVPRKEHR